MIFEKIPSLFAFLASVSRMKCAVLFCRFMQTLRRKMKIKNIPGAHSGANSRKSKHAPKY